MITLIHKVGDLVRIDPNLTVGPHGNCSVIGQMLKWAGGYYKICSINYRMGVYRLTGLPCLWTDEMFSEFGLKPEFSFGAYSDAYAGLFLVIPELWMWDAVIKCLEYEDSKGLIKHLPKRKLHIEQGTLTELFEKKSKGDIVGLDLYTLRPVYCLPFSYPSPDIQGHWTKPEGVNVYPNYLDYDWSRYEEGEYCSCGRDGLDKSSADMDKFLKEWVHG